jgi:hypothetical protein
MDKLVVISDGNHFMHTTLGGLGLYNKDSDLFKKGDNAEKVRKDRNKFLEKLSSVFTNDLTSMKASVDKFIFVIDDKMSWRKDYNMQNDYLGLPRTLDYKGNRKKDTTIDFNIIFETFVDFLKSLRSLGNVIVKKVKGCEGDDLISVLSSYFNLKGHNVVIYSGDDDLKQCIAYNKQNNCFTMLYQKQKKTVFIDRDIAIHLKNSVGKSMIVDYVKSFYINNKSKLSVCDPYEVVFDKVTTGDDGDNILPIFFEVKQYKEGAKKAGQDYESKISKRVMDKVKAEIEHTKFSIQDFYSDNFVSKLANSVHRNLNKDISASDIENNIKVNVDLVILNKLSIPSSIYDEIMEWAISLEESLQVTVISKLMYKQNILNECKFYDKRESDDSNYSSIFSDLGV